MSKAPTRFPRVKVAAARNISTKKAGVPSRAVAMKQSGKVTIGKKSVNSNAVTGKSVVTRSSKMQAPKKSDSKSSYGVNKLSLSSAGANAAGRKSGTKPVNASAYMRSPLSAPKSKSPILSKSATMKKRVNPTTHAAGTPLNPMRSTATARAKSKPINPYGHANQLSS